MVMIVKEHGSVNDISAKAWNNLLGCEGGRCPFLKQEFFAALEASGAASPTTGWTAKHLSIWADDQIKAIVPMYVKDHSYGEYVFDHAWANAFMRAGGQYYPKLVSAIPFTPVPGQRILTQYASDDVWDALITYFERSGYSSWHGLFSTQDAPSIHSSVMCRRDVQFHWKNDGYQSFDDFLTALNSRKRKQIKKERTKVLKSELNLKFLRGDDIKSHHWDGFVRCHEATVDRKWGQAYLNRETFEELQACMGHNLALSAAFYGTEMIAGAWCLIGHDTIFGRQWGARVQIEFLHFELCYYQTIAHAIDLGLDKVEAGVQGEHKLARGFEPIETRSLHWVQHQGFANAIQTFLDEESKYVEDVIAHYQERSPFKQK